jgi:PHD/YefM family antitoxin component YafN of YafNO toxin-antitoxin module
MILEFEEMILPITEFRHKMTQVLDELVSPRVLMNRDKPKAVLVPYEIYKGMEKALEGQMDEILIRVAEERVAESEAEYITHEKFWDEIGVE